MLLRMMKFSAILVLVLFVTQAARGQMHGWKMVHGDVLQVFSEQHKILLDVSGEKTIYTLERDCQILRFSVPTGLDSLRPITSGAFQDALCWINEQGRIAHILVNYAVSEEDGVLVAYDIFGNLK